MVERVHDLLHVGPVLADRILDHFGGKNPDGSPKRDDKTALETIRKQPHRLTEIRGIGRDTALSIIRTNFESRPTAMSLPGKSSKGKRAQQEASAESQIQRLPGVGAVLARRIVEVLGNPPGEDGPGDPVAALATLKRDPYALLQVPGIGYQSARRIAIEAFDVPLDDEAHNLHGNRFVLERGGGVLTLNHYRNQRAKLRLARQHEALGIEIQQGHAWLSEELQAEMLVARWAADCKTSGGLDDDLDDHDRTLIRRHGLNQEQAHAIDMSLQNRAFLLTGGAGTGKTTTVAAMIDILRKRGLNVHVMTLAGKSAERVARACHKTDIRLTESNTYGTSRDGYTPYVESAAGMTFVTTIHRGLRATGRGEFLIEQLAAHVVIIDEASMVPTRLLAEILQRLKPNSRVILVGDDAQLPPIGFGSPFEDFIRLELPHVHLTQNYRQADQESIHIFATAMRNRQRIPFRNAPGVTLHTGANTDEALLEVVEERLKRPPRERDAPLSVLEWQVLTSTNKVRARLNQLLQEYFNPDGDTLARVWENGQPQEVRRGDKIVIVRNDYEIDVMNGQTGLVTGAGRTPGSITVMIDERLVDVPADLVASHVRLGYCITVHKAQGSSWHTVISVEDGHVWGASNRLYYTTCTRAEHHVAFIASLDAKSWWADVTKPEPPRQSTLLARVAGSHTR